MLTETIPGVSFQDLWNRLSEKETRVCCTERRQREGWRPFISWNPKRIYTVMRGEQFEDLQAFVKAEQQQSRRIFGYISYDLSYKLHGIASHATDDLKLPTILLYSFDAYCELDRAGIKLCASDEAMLQQYRKEIYAILNRASVTQPKASPQTSTAEWCASMSPHEYKRAFASVKKYITAGDVYQLNLTHRLFGITQKTARELFPRMCEKNEVGFLAYMEASMERDQFEILSASPERFVRISNDRTIETFPIKGTRPRGRSYEEDQRFRKELLENVKENAELNMITDLLRNDIGKISEIGSVVLLQKRDLYAFTNVWHAQSHIRGTLRKDIRAIDTLLSMFPGGSVTGCPKKRAIEIIDEIEPVARGVYTGAIGFLDPDDSADFAIAIRTIVKKGNQAFLGVGGGIVYDSKWQREYEETFDKAKSFFGIL